MKDKEGGPHGTRRLPTRTASGLHPAAPHSEPKPESRPLGRQTSRQRAPKGPPGPDVEIISSGPEAPEGTRLRRRPGEVGEPHGLSLRWKIMIAMAGVTVTAALLIFVVVYDKTVDQLNAEIDAKGERLINTLASIDREFWLFAIHQGPADRKERLDQLYSRFLPDWNTRRRSILSANPDLGYRYEDLYSSLGREKVRSAKKILDEIKEQLKREKPEDAPRLDRDFRKVMEDGPWLKELEQLLDPLREVSPLQAGGIDLREGNDIVQISVQDITRSDQNAPTVSAKSAKMSVGSEQADAPHRVVRGIAIADRSVVETSEGGGKILIPSRSFTMDREHGDRKLRFWVLLSLDHINQARSQLRTAIFLPTLLSVLLGLAIAWLISQRITEPVKILMEDINQVSSGDLEHQTLSHSSDEIGMLASSFNRMTGALKAAHAQEIEAKAMEHELNIAAEIQANLVPKKVLKLPGYDISAYYRPSKEVGGDYYDFIDIDERHVGVIVADVSGKGVPGSLVMSMARAFVRMEAERSRNTSPSNTLVNVNRMLAQDIKKGMFVTAIYCIMDRETNEIAVSSAGHNPMVVWRAATSQVDLVNPKGIALGFDKGPVFERTISEEKIRIEKGDRLVLYTDGTVEAMNAAGEEFGDDTFFALCAQLATRDSNQFLNLVVKALDAHKGEAPQHDDQTIVTLRYL